MPKPELPHIPHFGPNMSAQQISQELETLRRTLGAQYAQFKPDVDPKEMMIRWVTSWEPMELSEEQLKQELDSGSPSKAALEILRKRANLHP